MSSSLGILYLPETSTIVGNDLFIVQQDNITKQVSFNNLIFGYDNATFSPTISAHTTEIAFLSTSLYSLSSQNTTEYNYLSSLIVNQVNNAFTNLSLAIYPISSIKCTSDNVNPGKYIANTVWTLVGQGQLLAGVGHTYENGAPYINGDKNRTNEYFYPGANAAAAGSPPGDLYYTNLVNSPVAGGSVTYKSGWEPYNYGGFTPNQPVIIVATPNTGYNFSSWTVTNQDGTTFGDVDTSVFGQISFYMPPNNVTVTGTFTPVSSPLAGVHYVTLLTNPVGGGSCSYQTGYGPTTESGYHYNDPVVIIGNAYAGYQLLGFTVNGSGFSQPVDYSKPGEVSFYMPASDVIVTANYGIAPANSLGEYNVQLDKTQIASHSHDFQIQLQNTNSTNGYQNGPQAAPAWRLDLNTTFTTLSNATTDTPHNNVPPIYGTYIWMRVA